MSVSTRPGLSVVIPFLNEEAVLPELRKRLEGLENLPRGFEIIFVSDGSTDGSIDVVEQWAFADPRIKLLVLTRNFGHQAAISAGLDHASGDFVGIMDADLQDPPEVLVEMYQEAVAGGWDIIHSVRSQRKGARLKRISYRLFYSLYTSLAESPVDAESGDFCVLSRRAVDALLSLPERVRFVRGLRSWLGLKTKAVQTSRPARIAGQPQYSRRKLIGLALTGLTSFSARPLRIATVTGMILCSAAMLMTIFYLATWFFLDLHATTPGFTTIVLLILFLSGFQFLLIGIIGEYIGQIFLEVKRRPTYLVDRQINLDRREAAGRR
jgi:glycosyltransferase involved in cell wall biosynthesis